MGRRVVSYVEDASTNLMDRLSHRLHWIDSSEKYDCHLCGTLFHWNPKMNCFMCGQVICMDCVVDIIVEGLVVDLLDGAVVPRILEIESCISCYHTTFLKLSKIFVDISEEIPLNDTFDRPYRDKRPASLNAIPERPPLSQKKSIKPIILHGKHSNDQDDRNKSIRWTR